MKLSIHYPTLAMGRPINPSALYTDARGLTGSEVTALEYAFGLARVGHRVTFFSNVSDPQISQGVVFKHDRQWEHNKGDGWDAVVSFMNAAPFMALEPGPFRVFNMQCGDYGGQPSGWEERVDVVCALAREHARVMLPTSALPADKYRVMPNGVDLARFAPAQKIPGRCIWASSHDRGLHHALELWPAIRAEVPHAEFHIFYDLQGIQKFAAMGQTDVPFLLELQRRSIYEVEMMKRLRGMGVVLRGPVSRESMAREMAQAEVLLYPTSPVRFTETFGCTVLETMAAECIPVICYADAFQELWASRGVPGVGYPYEEHRDEYREWVLEALANPKPYRSRLRDAAADFAWDKVVKDFARCLETRGTEGLAIPFAAKDEAQAGAA